MSRKATAVDRVQVVQGVGAHGKRFRLLGTMGSHLGISCRKMPTKFAFPKDIDEEQGREEG